MRGQGLWLVCVRIIVERRESALTCVGRAGVHYVEVDGVARSSSHDWVSARVCGMGGEERWGGNSPDAQSRHWFIRRRASDASAKKRLRSLGVRKLLPTSGRGEDGAERLWCTQPHEV